MINLIDEIKKVQDNYDLYLKEGKVCFGGIYNNEPSFFEKNDKKNYVKSTWVLSSGAILVHIIDNKHLYELEFYNKKYVNNIFYSNRVEGVNHHSLNASLVDKNKTPYYKLIYRNMVCSLDITDERTNIESVCNLIRQTYLAYASGETLFNFLLNNSVKLGIDLDNEK